MSSSFGSHIRYTLFGQSHGEAIGVVIDGLPSGIEIDFERLQAFLSRRSPGGAHASARSETDIPRFLSGLVGNKTCGAPLCALLANDDARPSDYAPFLYTPRPSHADFTARMRDGDAADLRGGGHFSGRLTAALCVAGGIALQALAAYGITVGAHIYSIADVYDTPFHPTQLSAEDISIPARRAFPALDEAAGLHMQQIIAEAHACGDSVGGVVECAAIGLPAGLGGNLFGGLESRLSEAIFAIPAVKGLEFGAGFAAAHMRGSLHNDAFIQEDGAVRTATNNHGGILGGLASGMPLLLRAALKPTPSILRPQQSVDLRSGEPATLQISGRHDACIAPRAVPCLEAATAAVLLDIYFQHAGGLHATTARHS